MTHDTIIGYDSQGWPLYPLRVISLLRAIGVDDDIIKQIPENILTLELSTSSNNYIVDCIINKTGHEYIRFT